MAKPTPSKPSKQPTSSTKKKSTEQENFERELKDLAAKAKEDTFGKWALEQGAIIRLSASLLALAATSATVSLLSLSPVYGSFPSSIYHEKVIMTALFLGWSFNLYLRRLIPVKPAHLIPVIAIYIPAVQFFLFRFSDFLSGRWGPAITEILTLFPLVVISVSCVATALDGLDLTHGRRLAWLSNALPGISSFVFFKGAEHVSMRVISSNIGRSIIVTRVGLQIVLSMLFSVLHPSKLLLFALPAALHTALFNYHISSPYHTGLLNSTMAKSDWMLLERQESLTGYVSVIESAERGFRAMRCDHSILGGEWLTSTTKTDIREPIYGVFVMLEAVRLVEVPEPVPDKEAKALVIGLGIGTTPVALHSHGVNTTIVEIDPAVYRFAVEYFAFPKEINAKITDAVTYTADLVKGGVEKFDYIIHDVFTGGAEPVELFTVEFITDLKNLLKPNGVAAINYAGDLLLPSARIVIHTILSVFPTCRIYRESADETTSTSKLDFSNMVIFCINTPSPPSSSSSSTHSSEDLSSSLPEGGSKKQKQKQITFRRPEVSDLLGSGARQMFIVPRHEILPAELGSREDVEADGGLLYRETASERFAVWHASSALGHWGVMRTVLPAWVWESW